MEHEEKRPDVGCRDGLSLKVADDFPQFVAILDRLLRDKADPDRGFVPGGVRVYITASDCGMAFVVMTG